MWRVTFEVLIAPLWARLHFTESRLSGVVIPYILYSSLNSLLHTPFTLLCHNLSTLYADSSVFAFIHRKIKRNTLVRMRGRESIQREWIKWGRKERESYKDGCELCFAWFGWAQTWIIILAIIKNEGGVMSVYLSVYNWITQHLMLLRLTCFGKWPPHGME